MKLLVFTVISAFLLLGCQSTSLDNQVTYRNALITIETVTKSNEQLSSQSGMGFVLTKDEVACYVVTAKHVIPQPYNKLLYKHWNSPTSHEDIEFIGASPDLDIAVLKLPLKGELCTPVHMETNLNSVKLGDEILAFGHPAIRYNEASARYYKSASSGVVSTFLDNYNGQSFPAIATTAMVSPGFSGSAVFSDFKSKSVKVIGMLVESFNQNSYQVDRSSPTLSIVLPSYILIQSASEIIENYKAKKTSNDLETKIEDVPSEPDDLPTGNSILEQK
jgi:S1-C subfamily serine protease